jgi:hypothetical protein
MYMYIYIYVYVYIYMYMYIYTYTYRPLKALMHPELDMYVLKKCRAIR